MSKLSSAMSLLAAVLVVSGLAAPGALAAGLNPVCGLIDDGHKLACDLRLSEAIEIVKLDASWDGGKTRQPVTLTPFDAGKSTIAANVLVNPISNGKAETLEALTKSIGSSGLDSLALSYRPGLAIAGKGAEEVLPIGTEAPDFGEKLQELFRSKSSGPLLQAVSAAVGSLLAKPADRRVLVVIGGAFRREDDASTIESVLTRARRGNLVIHTIGFAGDGLAEDVQPGLSILSSVTGGQHFALDLPDGQFPEDFAGRLIAATESGGYVTLPTDQGNGRSELQLIATLASGDEAVSSLPLDLPEKTAAAKLKDWIINFRTRQPALTATLAAVLGLLIIASFSMFLVKQLRRLRRSREQQVRAEPLRRAMAAADQTGAPDRTEIHRLRPNREVWFESLGSANTRMPIRGSMIRIGRHEENDVRLVSKTVHRYHAVMHRTPEDDYVVTDLSGPSGNGIIVNGAKVQNVALREGDVVELGDMKLRFRTSAAA